MKVRLALFQRASKERHSGLDIALESDMDRFKGVQIAFNNYTGVMQGVQCAIHNYGDHVRGFQAGMINDVTSVRGVQCGGYNGVRLLFRGLQVGLINQCGPDSFGVQVALVNIRSGNPWYSRAIPIMAVRTKLDRPSFY